MGMGEPLANYTNVSRALTTILDGDCGLKLSNRRVTISTSGLVPKLEALGREARVNVAISLNATENKTRDRLMPVNRKYPIEELLAACKRYPATPQRRITFEYILIEGVNDSMEDAKRLVALLKGIFAKINLIPFNEHPGCDFKRPKEAHIQRFQRYLLDRHCTSIIRWSKGGRHRGGLRPACRIEEEGDPGIDGRLTPDSSAKDNGASGSCRMPRFISEFGRTIRSAIRS